jgi:hypothetical protein
MSASFFQLRIGEEVVAWKDKTECGQEPLALQRKPTISADSRGPYCGVEGLL